MSNSKKPKVRKQTPGGNALINQLRFDKELWTARVLAYQEQYSADAFMLALAEEGFGAERLNRVYARYMVKKKEIEALQKGDTDDLEYSESVVEKALQKACGKYYVPRSERYAVTIIEANGTKHHFQREE